MSEENQVNENAENENQESTGSTEVKDEEKTLETLQDEGQDGEGKEADINRILDIPVKISVEIGSNSINIKKLLGLSQGSVVELDRLAGEPLDVKVNNTLIARGEVVVVNEKFGVRLTDVVSKQERLEQLSE